MEHYVFPLQKLLDIRIDKEEQSKRQFMEAQRQKMIVEQKLDDMKEDYKKHNVLNKKITTIEAKIKNNYLNALNSGIETASNELKTKMETVEENRKDLQQKQIDRKTVEIIKDKRTEAFIREQNRLEQIRNDEFALYAYIRNIGSERR
jgi:flagellar protein FliJ